MSASQSSTVPPGEPQHASPPTLSLEALLTSPGMPWYALVCPAMPWYALVCPLEDHGMSSY